MLQRDECWDIQVASALKHSLYVYEVFNVKGAPRTLCAYFSYQLHIF